METRFQVEDLLGSTRASQETREEVLTLLDGKVVEILKPFVLRAVMNVCDSEHLDVSLGEVRTRLVQLGFSQVTLSDVDILVAFKQLEVEGELRIRKENGDIVIRVVPIAFPINR